MPLRGSLGRCRAEGFFLGGGKGSNWQAEGRRVGGCVHTQPCFARCVAVGGG